MSFKNRGVMSKGFKEHGAPEEPVVNEDINSNPPVVNYIKDKQEQSYKWPICLSLLLMAVSFSAINFYKKAEMKSVENTLLSEELKIIKDKQVEEAEFLQREKMNRFKKI